LRLLFPKKGSNGSTTPDEKLPMQLARWIVSARPTRFNARETRRKLNGPLRDATSMNKACDALIEGGWIRPVHKDLGPGKGRPSTDFDVNPACLSQHKAA
jgi:hypothetical protein